MNKLNWDKEFALEQAADDAELLQELLDIFKDSCMSDFELIKEGIEKEDADQVCSASHSMKGAAASLGVDGIREITYRIEKDSREGSVQVGRENLDELQELLSQLQEI